MANWASTSYRIEGSKSDLERVYGMIDNFMSERRKPVEENASKEWEGNVVKALGATDEQVSKNYLRGFIQEYEMDGDTIRIEAEERAMAYAANLMDMEMVSKAKIESWNEDHEADGDFIYIHEFKYVA